MAITRRAFNTLLASASLTPLLSALPSRFSHPIGLQLYTVRDIFPKDPERVLAAISEMGYREVEGIDSDQLLKMQPLLQKYKLAAASCHVLSVLVSEDRAAYGNNPPVPANVTLDHVLENLQKLGTKYIAVSYVPVQERDRQNFWPKFAEQMNKAGEKCASAGLTLCYHNHAHDFAPVNGIAPWDTLMSKCDPKLVAAELDVFWAEVAGRDPAKMIRELGSRVPLLHLKDVAKQTATQLVTEKVPSDAFKEVGSGRVNFHEVLAAAEKAGVKHYFVEQDHTPGDPLVSIKKSIDYLKSVEV